MPPPPPNASFSTISSVSVEDSRTSVATTGAEDAFADSFAADIFERDNEEESRSVDSRHHHHHIIPIDSETDFRKMHIDEKKVNYLPYHPATAVSQTGLIQSIGRPFSKNHAKYLPDPGDEFMLTRRASEVKLKHIMMFGNVNPKIVEGLARTVSICSHLIGGTGLVFFIFLLTVAGLYSPMEFTRYFLDKHMLCKLAYITGAVQPITVAPYCKYALLNLKFIRSYFLRVPLLQFIPAGMILSGLLQFTESLKTNGLLDQFLQIRMSQYHSDVFFSREAQVVWNGIQKMFDCCGYNGHQDWLVYNNTQLPLSCCQTLTISGLCPANSPAKFTTGCGPIYKRVNMVIALIFLVFACAIAAFEVLSVIFMRSLYACIGDELYDERSSFAILGGKFCSLCEVEDTDVEIEYDETQTAHSSDEEDNKPTYIPLGGNTSVASSGGRGRGRTSISSGRASSKVGPAGRGRGTHKS